MENTFVINLKECKKRMTSLGKNLNDFGIQYERWDATKGSEMTPQEKRENTSYLCRNILCNNGTIGCHMSHLRLWDHISRRYGCDKYIWFMILEDDAKISADFVKNLHGVFSDLRDWDHTKNRYPEFIHLSCNKLCHIGSNVTPHISSSSIVTTTRAYLISASGACKLIDKIKVIQYHVDMYLTLQQLIDKSLAYYITKNYVDNNDNFSSTISSNTFPRILLDIINLFLSSTGLDEYHICFNSAIMSFPKVLDLNIMIIIFIVLSAILFAKHYYMLACLYISMEISYYLIHRLKKKKTSSC